ncbi:hypothetical protein [Paraburkholderia sp. HD33-4]|uniref:hypothetical protein n=1 Tax=Paraburkholderia sp. HD33-4 TaxID=2883242 RepID=UPI001F1941F0|nr:hypothetical protein [Paraburkholderia sp. HD33-4]
MKITGTVRRVFSASPTGGAIFSLQAETRAEPIRVKADYSVLYDAPFIGERLTLSGDFRLDVYGKQFVPTLVLPELPTANSAPELLLNHPAFSTLGKRHISKICRKIGVQMLSVLETHDFAALNSAGVDGRMANAMTIAWTDYKTRIQTCRFLLERGLSWSTAALAAELWDSSAVSVISADPYVLAAICDWDEVDNAATRFFGVAFDCPRRIRGCCESICNTAVAHRKAAVTLKAFEQAFQARTGMNIHPNASIGPWLAGGSVRRVRGQGHDFVQGAGMTNIEASIHRHIMSVLNRDQDARPQSNSPHNHNAELRPHEQRLLEVLSETRVATIEAPGASAVIAVEAVARCFPKAIHISPTSALFANTGRLRLDWYLLREFIIDDALPRPVDGMTVVIHDCTAIDVLLVNKLLRNVQEATRLIFIGDPSVTAGSGPGEIFNALLSEPALVHENVSAFLEQHERTTPLVRLPAILSRTFRPADYRLKALRFVQAGTRNELVDLTLQSYRAVFETEPHNGVIVASSHNLATELNHRVHEELLEYLAIPDPEPPILKLRNKQEATVGDVVIFLGRDYAKGLFPGSRGVIARISQSGRSRSARLSAAAVRVLFDTAGYVDLTLQECELMSLGHAVQVQHVMLSRWKKLIVAMESSKTLNHSWCRHALARADREIVILAAEGVFEDALRRRESESTYVPSLNLCKI